MTTPLSLTQRARQARLHVAKLLEPGASPPRYMYDSYAGTGIPGGARMVAGYPWWPQYSWDRFSRVPEIRIVTSASEDWGDVLDCERGDAYPSQCGGWISRRKAAGYFRPTIYCAESNYWQVRAGTGRWRLGVDYDIWIAFWNNYPTSYPGTVAHQYYSRPDQAYDLSVVFDSGWPHRHPSSPPKPKPKPKPRTAYDIPGNLHSMPGAKSATVLWNAPSPTSGLYHAQFLNGAGQVMRETHTVDLLWHIGGLKPDDGGYSWRIATDEKKGGLKSSGWSRRMQCKTHPMKVEAPAVTPPVPDQPV